jgi:acyl carrier protein
VSEQDDRLVRCFASVFPTLSEGEIRTAAVGPLFEVDSLAWVTLVALIDQEFGVNAEPSDLLELGSFEGISQFLQRHRTSEVPDE